MAITNLLTAYSDLDDLMTPVSTVEGTTSSQIYTTAVAHSLKVGDYVNVVNIANDSGSFNGRYQVGEVNVNGVEFTVTGLTRSAVGSAATTGVAASVGDLEPGLIVEESLSEVVTGGTPNDTNDTIALGTGQVAAIDVGVGDFVTISGANGTDVANGTFSVTAVATDTLSFPSSASPALTQVAANFTIFKSDNSGNALIRGSYRTSEITVIAVQPDGSKTKTIKFNKTENGALENAGTGITGQALYSYFKFLWKNVQSITQFDFPMLSITNEQFEFINSWYLDDASTIDQELVLASSSFAVNFTDSTTFTSSVSDVDLRKLQDGDNITIQGGNNAGTTATVSSVGYNRSTGVYTVSVSAGTFSNTGADTITSVDTVVTVTPSNLIRTAGWTVQNNTGEYQKLYYSGVITLGTLVDETDTPYYVQRDALTAGTNDTKYSGPANEGVRIRSVADARSSAANVAIDYTAAAGASTITEDTTTKIDWTAFEVGDFIEITDASVTASDITGVLHEITAVSSTGITTGSTFGATDGTTGSALIEADFAGTFKIFVRELGKTFADADLDDIGVSEMTYIVYRFPVTNSSDADVPTSIEDITIGGAAGLTATLSSLTAEPYDDIQISYLEASAGVPYDIKGSIGSGSAVSVAVGEVYKDGDGRWFKVTTAGSVDTTSGTGNFAGYTLSTAVLAAYEGEREISDVYYAFTVIVDANDNHANAGSPYVDDNDNFVLVGGCALNVLFNQKLKKYLSTKSKQLYVPSNPNDCGLALGQFLLEHPDAQSNVYGGFDILDRNELQEYIESRSARAVSVKEITDLVKAGKIIGLVYGYSEVGPRALGNRSIICDPSIADMKDILNAKVKFREWFRPFAPVCRLQDKSKYFDNVYDSEFMSYAPGVKDEFRSKLKSISHADGTARLQTVTDYQHEMFYDILTELDDRNEIPVILNTSFNIKGKPILTTIQDALYCLDNTEMDYVVIENWLFKRK